MINLYKFYKDNVKEDEYYYKFYNNIVVTPHQIFQQMSDFFSTDEKEEYEAYEVYDIEEVIDKFKYLCQPDTDISSDVNKRLFYYVCFCGGFFGMDYIYTIKEFPKILSRPPSEPSEFTYKEMRRKLVSMGKQESNGIVPYAVRRSLIEKLTFEISSTIEIKEDIDMLFIKVSTRNANFESMSKDEKLKEIANLIEYMLYDKISKQYKKLDYNIIVFDYFDDEMIKCFKKQIQCFRHASENALKERENFSDVQKDFLIDYGITIIKVIYQLVSKQS